MSRLLPELENVLRALADEHRRLLAHVEGQQAAMKAFNLKAMDDARNQQEASRLRIATLETKRRTVVAHIAKGLKLDGNITLARIADLHPARRDALLAVRNEIKQLAETIATRSHIAGRLASSVLGHLNTVVRLFAGAVEKAGLYTKHGVPSVSSRIGVMEAVG
jgi:FlgN protein